MVEEQVYKMESRDSQERLFVFKVDMTKLSMWREEQGEEEEREGSQVQSQEGKWIKSQ